MKEFRQSFVTNKVVGSLLFQEDNDVDAADMEEDVDGDLADLENLNYDDLDSVSKLQKTQRYIDIIQVSCSHFFWSYYKLTTVKHLNCGCCFIVFLDITPNWGQMLLMQPPLWSCYSCRHPIKLDVAAKIMVTYCCLKPCSQLLLVGPPISLLLLSQF